MEIELGQYSPVDARTHAQSTALHISIPIRYIDSGNLSSQLCSLHCEKKHQVSEFRVAHIVHGAHSILHGSDSPPAEHEGGLSGSRW
jgi:hypothetical protein